MTDATKLFRSGKRYRGFAQVNGGYQPVAFTLYAVNEREVRLKHIFPNSLTSRFKEGNVIYVLIEEEKRLIGELRVVENDPDKKFILARLDFLTEDRRKLPRVSVEGNLDIEAKLTCGGKRFEGKVRDISLASASIEVGTDLKEQECEVELNYRGFKTRAAGKVVRSSGGSVVIEFTSDADDIASLLSRVYSDLFLKLQRES
ncbi:PilZ domain-containing protein [Hydrogenivirga caldilitoris]|uniref:PilZ domain-containing protein n=1 Tax=Hydrogenivirga caldilitoris TaxID=246264 RepID=A0A497XWJ5_9AQUI|nr:PilZ domain-containing protein [Hydrogenivirga caldilitoris]RLJ71133.1 PilZ domain-containing protein [Hydrogenivirga caldilitoris]